MLVAVIAFILLLYCFFFCIAYFIIFAMCKTAKQADDMAYDMYINEKRKEDVNNE